MTITCGIESAAGTAAPGRVGVFASSGSAAVRASALGKATSVYSSWTFTVCPGSSLSAPRTTIRSPARKVPSICTWLA
jgi:hypothetical protein